MTLLQVFGLPGGPELLVIMLIALLLFGIPMALVLLFGVAWLRSSGRVSEERVEQLEAEIETLRAELADDGNGDGNADAGSADSGDDSTDSDERE
jgi:sec-independent protein translocase protein TatA